jgi:CDP-paratose 2-epimerase
MSKEENPKTILITGGCGFVGSNLAIELKMKYSAYRILVIDNLSRSGSELNISRLQQHGIKFLHGDLRIKDDLQIEEKIDCIIDAAAEASALAGIHSSTDYVINTNFNGTVNTLNLALKHKADLIFLSTSRVYPIQYLESINYEETEDRFEISALQSLEGITQKGISEAFPLNKARTIYGTTKLASELLIEEYKEFLGLNFVINRCGVITGPCQMGKVDQGVIVLWMARHFWKKSVSYLGYNGTGKQVRDIVSINDVFTLIDFQIHNIKKVNGETFNVGGGREISVSLKELTNWCSLITGNKIQINSVKESRKGDIPIYISDCRKISQVSLWKPEKNVEEILENIFEWIKSNERQLKPILDK